MSEQKQVLVRRLRAIEPTRGAEVGVFIGKTSAHLLASFPGLHLYMVDAWDGRAYSTSEDPISLRGDFDSLHQRAMDRTAPYRVRTTVLRMPSLLAADQVENGSLDFAFIDADHSYAATLADCRAWWPKVRPGGILFGHDYGWKVKWLEGCTQAYNEFGADVDVKPVIDDWWVVCFYK